jgi:hypothetical protein
MSESTRSKTARAEEDYASHVVRLSPRQWRLAAVLAALLALAAPRAWEAVERFQPGPDYRIPYGLSGDYWHFSRYCRRAVSGGRIALLGDSVIWGQYVRPGETLSSCLNAVTGSGVFANLGVDGMHPAALGGLVRYYGQGLAGARVILHCNPLWMSSDRHDLRGEREFAFNHPDLVPQFTERIPCYRQSFSGRLDIVVDRSLPVLGWTRHLRLAYYDGQPVPQWSLDHPYECPVRPLAGGLPAPADKAPHEPLSWQERGMGVQDMPWVPAGDSFQWRMFRRTVECLRGRGADVFVLVGPFNEHLLTPDARSRYEQIRHDIVSWLTAQELPLLAPPALPSGEYADASHPLAPGYARLAGLLFADEGFRSFAGR